MAKSPLADLVISAALRWAHHKGGGLRRTLDVRDQFSSGNEIRSISFYQISLARISPQRLLGQTFTSITSCAMRRRTDPVATADQPIHARLLVTVGIRPSPPTTATKERARPDASSAVKLTYYLSPG